MFFRRRNFDARTLLEFQIVAIFLISESFESPTTPRGAIFSDKDVPSEFPRHSNEAEFHGAPILDMKTFENNTSFRDVINSINQIVRQKSNLAKQPTHLEGASKDTQPHGIGTTIYYIQSITIYQNSTEKAKWFLLAATVILVAVYLALTSRRIFYKNQYWKGEHLIERNEFKESNNVINRK